MKFVRLSSRCTFKSVKINLRKKRMKMKVRMDQVRSQMRAMKKKRKITWEVV
jgi:hypothetical protein